MSWVLLATAALVAAPPVVPAIPLRCSVSTLRHNPEGYHYPLESIRQFVAEAKTIVRAVAVDTTKWEWESSELPLAADTRTGVTFRVVETMRGRVPGDTLVLPGILVPHDDFNAGPVPYRMVRRAGQRGNCFAREYRAGATYLLLLREGPTGPTPHWAPLAPLNEQLRGDDDPWLAWVRDQMVNVHGG